MFSLNKSFKLLFGETNAFYWQISKHSKNIDDLRALKFRLHTQQIKKTCVKTEDTVRHTNANPFTSYLPWFLPFVLLLGFSEFVVCFSGVWVIMIVLSQAYAGDCPLKKKKHCVKVYGNGGNKKLQLVLQHCCQTSWIAILHVLLVTFKPVLQQFSLLQVAQIRRRK